MLFLLAHSTMEFSIQSYKKSKIFIQCEAIKAYILQTDPKTKEEKELQGQVECQAN